MSLLLLKQKDDRQIPSSPFTVWDFSSYFCWLPLKMAGELQIQLKQAVLMGYIPVNTLSMAFDIS